MLLKSRIYQIVNEETNKTIKKTSNINTAKIKADKLVQSGINVKVVVDGMTYYDPNPLVDLEGFFMSDCYDTHGELEE